MSKTFRDWNLGQDFLLPLSVHDFVPAGHLSRFVVALVTEELDLSAIMTSYKGEKGQPPYYPTMMAALLLYAYAVGIYSSRRIARACAERVDFMAIVALDAPDFRTISEFRRRHLKALAGLFLQVLKLCERAGLVSLGHVALDGTKIKANASKHKAMSYEYMKKREAELQVEVDGWLNAAEATPRRTRRSGRTSAATNCRTGWPTSMRAWSGFERQRPNWKPRRKPRCRPSRPHGRRRTISLDLAAKQRCHWRNRSRKRSATSPTPRAEFSRLRTATSKATTRRLRWMRIIRSSWHTRSVTTAVISHTLRRCSMASRPTSGAIPTKYRPMPATARQPISAPSAGEGSKVTSLPADRSMEPSRPPAPDRPSPDRYSLGWLSGSDARGIVAVTDYASRWSSRYSDRLRKREGSGSSCCEGSTR